MLSGLKHGLSERLLLMRVIAFNELQALLNRQSITLIQRTVVLHWPVFCGPQERGNLSETISATEREQPGNYP